jgi:creatinine amidohydrolase
MIHSSVDPDARHRRAALDAIGQLLPTGTPATLQSLRMHCRSHVFRSSFRRLPGMTNTRVGQKVDVFADTIAEMTWQEVEQAAQRGAVLLWAFGVIEQHGPHLPAGTDVYVPSARLQQLKRRLADRNIEALIVPPYYWGVNQVSASFPASYTVRPEVMIELMADVFASVRRDGFSRVFCFSGHGDPSHNLTIFRGVVEGANRTGMRIGFVTDRDLAARIGLAADDPHLVLYKPAVRPVGGLDIHAGEVETSTMMCYCGSLVRDHFLTSLLSTDYGPADLAEWRQGGAHARRKTPLGYFGNPAAARHETGKRSTEALVEKLAMAIESRIAASATSG